MRARRPGTWGGWKGEEETRASHYSLSGVVVGGVQEVVSGGVIRSAGKQSYDVGDGFWIGVEDGGISAFGFGDADNYVRWREGEALALSGNIRATGGEFSGEVQIGEDGALYGLDDDGIGEAWRLDRYGLKLRVFEDMNAVWWEQEDANQYGYMGVQEIPDDEATWFHLYVNSTANTQNNLRLAVMNPPDNVGDVGASVHLINNDLAIGSPASGIEMKVAIPFTDPVEYLNFSLAQRSLRLWRDDDDGVKFMNFHDSGMRLDGSNRWVKLAADGSDIYAGDFGYEQHFRLRGSAAEAWVFDDREVSFWLDEANDELVFDVIYFDGTTEKQGRISLV